ncbi:hypothetical protein [Streptomyces sp. NPDC059224]|uniref:hypothetical protein n=1 Tax=Streptomyces sp. NPDC059224 TaxID=3346775 RepID=UPI0036B93C33
MEETPQSGPGEVKPRPDYPPKTPPPSKKPPSPPTPDPSREDLLAGLPVPQNVSRTEFPVMKSRRGASWTLEAAPWAPGKASRLVSAQLSRWHLTPPAAVDEAVRFLAATVVEDGGRRISVHLSEQDHTALVLCLGHQQTQAGEATELLTELRALAVDSCGTEMTADGRQVWALFPVHPAATAARSTASA